MLAFEVSVNGKRRYVAGHADARILNISMHGIALPALPTSFGLLGSVAVPGAIEGELSTLSYPDDRLSLGDEVTIRIIEVDRADLPTKRNSTLGSATNVAEGG